MCCEEVKNNHFPWDPYLISRDRAFGRSRNGLPLADDVDRGPVPVPSEGVLNLTRMKNVFWHGHSIYADENLIFSNSTLNLPLPPPPPPPIDILENKFHSWLNNNALN